MIPCVACSKKRDEKRDDQCGLVCFKCSGRILRYLRELEEWLPVLPRMKMAPGITEYQRPVFGSRSPANDAAIVHADPRSEWDEETGLGAMAVITSWAELVREERGLTAPRSDAFGEDMHLLRTSHNWITQQPWVDEYTRELREVNFSVRALVGDPIPRSVGYCIRFNNNVECKGDVFELDDASGVKCSRCSAIYTGLDLERFRVAQEAG